MGWPGVLLGAIVEPPIEPDWGPVASAPSPEAAKMPTDRADSTPASNSEVILMVIMVRLQDESLPDVGVKGSTVPTSQPSIGNDCVNGSSIAAMACVIQAPGPSMAAVVSERSDSALVKKHRERSIPIRQTIDRKVY
jgi:hypothetical protein